MHMSRRNFKKNLMIVIMALFRNGEVLAPPPFVPKPFSPSQSLRSAHLGMCLKTSSSGQPKPCEGIWVDDMIID